MHPYSRLAASLIMLVALVTLFLPTPGSQAFAQDGIIMVPDGGRLEAHDEDGNLIGPCPLEHTDVNVEISGFFSRVTVTQSYQNPYDNKIEAVYTFPLSHRAAVDRMTMTVGDRVVQGEVKEREKAKQIYQAAREQGYVASLLEQERPNIFTQSVANIEPGAKIDIEISYVEILQSTDGEYTFDFPMVVGPRYIPGATMTSPVLAPAELTIRRGVILLGPAKLTIGAAGEPGELGTLQTGKLHTLLGAAQPIQYPDDKWWGAGDESGGAQQPTLWHRFQAEYCDGSKEFGELYTDGTGWINGRWFYTDPKAIEGAGTGFSTDTNQVPDASRITPEPVRPGKRAGHDISVTVKLDTGGPMITALRSTLHEIRGDEFLSQRHQQSQTTITLAEKNEIPNRDFALSWKTNAQSIEEAKLTHAGEKGGFFTLILNPPDRVQEADIPPRELVFVMDTSGSMRGFPIDKSKEVISKAIDAMRPTDTFNVITFAGRTAVLWSESKPATEGYRAQAQNFINNQQGGGGTEMMKAIDAALVQHEDKLRGALTPTQLADLPADGRAVEVVTPYGSIESMGDHYVMALAEDLKLRLDLQVDLPTVFQPEGVDLRLHGRWETQDGRRVFVIQRAALEGLKTSTRPMRIVLFLTDGHVGNDMAIIDAVRKNAHTTRVFSFGIGNSVNRYLLDEMANAGRGEAEFVLLESDSEAAVERFTKRVETPVLTDINLAFSDGLEITDTIPPIDRVRDLFDVEPLIIHGRYSNPGVGTLTITGNTGAGPYKRVLDLELHEQQAEHDVIATLWARAKVDQIMNSDLEAAQQNAFPAEKKQQVVALGEEFQIMTQFTSFVAVEKSRTTIDGQPVLVAVPIEMPSGMSYEGVFGGLIEQAGREIFLGAQLQMENKWRRVAAATPARSAPDESDETEDRARIMQDEGPALISSSSVSEASAMERNSSSLRNRRLVDEQNRRDPKRREAARQQMIDENIRRVRQLQLELKYSEALQVLDQTLFIDEHNTAALALKEVIVALMLYRQSDDIRRAKDWSYTQQWMGAHQSSIAPDVNYGARPGLLSTKAILEYPRDWAELSLRRTLVDEDTDLGRSEGIELGRKRGAGAKLAMRQFFEQTNAAGTSVDKSGNMRGRAQEQILSFSANLPFGRPADGKVAAGYVVQPDGSFVLRNQLSIVFGGDVDEAGLTPGWFELVSPGFNADGTIGPAAEGWFNGKPDNTPLFGDIPVVGESFKNAPSLDLDAALNQGGSGGGGRGFGGGGGGSGGGVRTNLGVAAGSDASIFGQLAETDDEDQRLSVRQAMKRAVEIMAYRDAAIELGEAEATSMDDVETPGAEQSQADVAAGLAPVSERADDIETAPTETPTEAAAPSVSLIQILFIHAGRPLLAPELVILINTFTQEGDVEVARKLTEELAAALPQYAVAVQLREAFASAELDDAQRAEAVAEIAEQAHAQMIATINAVLRYVRIENVLDERLRPFAAASGFPEELGADIYDGPTPQDAEWVDGGILLTVKIESLDEKVIETLEEYARLVVKTTVERDSFIVGVVPLGRLDDLALIPEVVWVEPARISPNDG